MYNRYYDITIFCAGMEGFFLDVYRRFDTQKNIRLYMADIYKKIDKSDTGLTEKMLNYYRLKLSILKEMSGIIRQDNDQKLKEIEKEFLNLKRNASSFIIKNEFNEVV